MTVTEHNELERVQDVAKRLAVSRSKVYLLMDGGQLPYVKLGKSRRVPRWAVEKLIEQNTIGRPQLA